MPASCIWANLTMANALKQLIEGNLAVEIIKKQLSDEKSQHNHGNGGLDCQSFKTAEFIPYFLNYLREESSCHFTSNLPIISPKKIKKKKRFPRHRTPTSDTSNDSTKSSARESLFSSPPSGRSSIVNLSPVNRVQASKVKESPNRTGSPVSHSGNSFGGRETSRVSRVTSTPVKFDLDEDFPPVSSQNISARKSSTPTRRITPTPARTRRNSSNVNSFSFENSAESDRSFSTEKLKQRRKHASSSASPKISAKACVKLKLEDFMQQGSRNRTFSPSPRENAVDTDVSRNSEQNSSFLDISESSSFNASINDEPVLPKKELVRDAEGRVLKNLAEIHSFCILENLVPNIVVEMCFILQLLTVEGDVKEHNDDETTGFLKTVHNCVFYAVHVLERLFRIIKLLDKGTLRLLLDNPRILEFSSRFSEELKNVYHTISINKVPYSLLKSPLNSVPFQASIDNRQNFSTDQAFHCFKRQRDTFYEIAREWEEQRGKPGWFLEERLGSKIRYIVHQPPGLANLAHFARLFQSQLIQMCCYENILPTFNEGESTEFVGNLFKSNPEKFFRLRQRLVAPLSTTTGPCPAPGFTETEEFFREFIVAAMSPSFNRYLMDSFIMKIIELNGMAMDADLDNSMTAEDENKADANSKQQMNFASCLITLRTLAKFLGFLVFSAYHNSADVPKAVKDTMILTRNTVTQQIHLIFYIKKALKEQRLVLTLPWVIEYLSMMDAVCPFLDYYIEVFDFLHLIYRTTLSQRSLLDMSRNNLMLSVGLGWLFEMPVIPDTMFSKSSERISLDSGQPNASSGLDHMDLVDQHLLYTCCPYLGELRSILAEAVVGKPNKRGYMKKIKPICADNVEASPLSCPLLQTQLEDNFFRNQPEFLKKDVDFITTRIYQNMINMVKNLIIPSELEKAKRTLVTETSFGIRNWHEVNKDDFKEKNKVLIMKLCNKTADGVMERISSDANKECESRSLIALQSLTPQDINEIIIKTAAGIVHQAAMNKLMEWTHQNLSAIIDKVVRKEMDKMVTREQNLPMNTYRIHAEDTEHPFNWFYQKLLDKSQESEGDTTQSREEPFAGDSQVNDAVEKKTALEDR